MVIMLALIAAGALPTSALDKLHKTCVFLQSTSRPCSSRLWMFFAYIAVLFELSVTHDLHSILSRRWRHPESDRIIELKHTDHDIFHRKTTVAIDGVVHLEHHTDHFKDGGSTDGAPRLCSPKCDCVMDKDNNCVAEGLAKLGLLPRKGSDDESDTVESQERRTDL